MLTGNESRTNNFIHHLSGWLFGWAHPSYQSGTILDDEEWRRQHDEISKTIWSLVSLLAGACIFCLITLAAPDATLISPDAKISIPVVSSNVSYTGFLFFGPVVLIGMAVYLHVFIEQRLRVGSSKSQLSLPLVFNLGRPASRLVSALLFYWMLPCVLTVFVFRALPRPDAPLLIFLSTGASVLFLVLGIRRFAAERQLPLTIPARIMLGTLWLLLAASVILLFWLAPLMQPILSSFTSFLSTTPTQQTTTATQQTAAPRRNFRRDSSTLPTRRLQLYGAPLDKKDLSSLYAPYADMRKADLREADLEESILTNADLRKADLTKANLTSADLTGAHLEGAILADATLNFADLANVTVDDFTQMEIRWRRVACIRRDDLSQDCLRSPDLAWTNLSNANLGELGKGKLQGAALTLRGADLRYADLSKAELTGVDLRFADLRNIQFNPSLQQAHLDGALLTAQAGVHADDALVQLENRTTETCLQSPLTAPDLPGVISRPSISNDVHCVKNRNRYKWYAKRIKNGYITFRSSIIDRKTCLDGSTATNEGAQSEVWQCNDDYPTQHWGINLVTDGFVMLVRGDTGFCLESTSRDHEQVPFLAKCNESDHGQQWKITLAK
jgi:uncharacterized protein YjbI with pentapeptide repeats